MTPYNVCVYEISVRLHQESRVIPVRRNVECSATFILSSNDCTPRLFYERSTVPIDWVENPMDSGGNSLYVFRLAITSWHSYCLSLSL